MVPNLFSPAFKQTDPLIVKAQIEDSLQMEDKGMINFYDAMIKRRDNSDILGTATFPIQWICGMDDVVIPYKKILGKYHNSDINFVNFYNNCGHMSMLEAPGKLVSDLVEFIRYSYHYQHRLT